MDKHELLTRRKDHFATPINEPSTVERHVVDNIEQRPTQHWIYKFQNLDKAWKVISLLRDRKSPSADELHPKVIKKRGRRFVEVLYTIIKEAWENLEIHTNWKDA